MVWEAAAPGCARHSASAGESFQLGVLSSTSGVTFLLLQTARVAVSSTSRSSTSYYACLLSNKRITFCYRHTHTHTYIGVGEGNLCPSVCLLVVFSQQIVQDVDC